MKNFLLFYLLISINLLNAADELDRISTISPLSYDKRSIPAQTIKSIVTVGIGNLIVTDINAEVKKKITPYSGDLSIYFPLPNELDQFVDDIVNSCKNNTISDSLTDKKLISFYKCLGTKLIGGMTDRILTSEGVKNSTRRELWIKNLLRPFDFCIDISQNSQYDASHCINALATSLLPNIGLALVYEISKENLSSNLPEKQQVDFNYDQTKYYKECFKKTSGNSNDVKSCSLQTIKLGVLKISDLKLSKIISDKSSTASAAKLIRQAVFPSYSVCIQKIGNDKNLPRELKDQFVDCIDELIKKTGMSLVEDNVSNHPDLNSSFSKKELALLASDEKQSFKGCAENQYKNNIRVDGLLDTTKCEKLIPNEVTYKVVLKSLNDAALDSFKPSFSLAIKFGNEGKALLDQCWNNDQDPKQMEACLRKTVSSFAFKIASFKVYDAIPDSFKNKKEIAESNLAEFNVCIEKQLPTNISKEHKLAAKIDVCAYKLTRDIALKLATDSINSKALEKELDKNDTNHLVKNFVEQKFMTCLGPTPSEKIIDDCSGKLRKNAALYMAPLEIRKNATDKLLPSEIDELIHSSVNKTFNECLGNSPAEKNLDVCISDLTKSATKTIVLQYAKNQLKKQLRAETPPSWFKVFEKTFSSCIDKIGGTEENASRKMDECIKDFSLEFARTLGTLKLNSVMVTVLGPKTYNEQKKNVDQILKKYDECLDNLKNFNLQDILIKFLDYCTDSLEQRSLNFVSSTISTWMTTDEKDASTLLVKNEFASIIPCLNKFMPEAPQSAKIQENAESILKPVSLLLAQYIEYSPGDAKRSLDDIIKKLSTDLKDVATNPASKKSLIESLYNNGALDQFLKSFIRSEVKKSFEQIPESELPKDLRMSLLSKENFDKIFSDNEGKSIVKTVMDKILKPVLMEQADLKSPQMTAGMNSTKDRVTKLLVNSPYFGEQIVKTSIQDKINNKDGFTLFFAKVLYGKNSIVWEKVRTTPDGKIAESYIKDNILLPKFSGKSLSPKEEKIYNGEAEKLVKRAMEKYD